MSDWQSALRARYGGSESVPGALLSAPSIDALECLLGHRSVRAYRSTPLNETILPALVAAAQSAASSSNLQIWSVVAVTDEARRARLSALAGNQAHIREAPLFLVWLADLSRLDRMADRESLEPGANRYLEMYTMAVVDAALAAQNAVVAAEAMGLGTVYIGAMRNRPEEVSAELGLPDDCFAVFGLCVGHPDPARATAVKPRLRQSVVVHRECYSVDGEAEVLAAYDGQMSAFQQQQSMPVTGWIRHSLGRVAGPGSMSGRHRLREALGKLGFRLE